MLMLVSSSLLVTCPTEKKTEHNKVYCSRHTEKLCYDNYSHTIQTPSTAMTLAFQDIDQFRKFGYFGNFGHF